MVVKADSGIGKRVSDREKDTENGEKGEENAQTISETSVKNDETVPSSSKKSRKTN
jgi:hypothetical protein